MRPEIGRFLYFDLYPYIDSAQPLWFIWMLMTFGEEQMGIHTKMYVGIFTFMILLSFGLAGCASNNEHQEGGDLPQLRKKR